MMTKTNVRYLLTFAAVIWFAPMTYGVDALVTAASGQPYGVATIEIPNETPGAGQELLPLQAIDESGRVLFPISENVRVEVPRNPGRRIQRPGLQRPGLQRPGLQREELQREGLQRQGRGRFAERVGGLIRQIAGEDGKQYQTVARRLSFLFLGSQPIRVQLADARGEIGTYTVQPEKDPAAYKQILANWWTGYTDGAKRQMDAADYPVWVESYLVAMLAGRLRLPVPEWYLAKSSDDDEVMSTLKLIGGAKATGDAIFRSAAVGVVESAEATLPLPDPPNWSPMYSEAGLEQIEVEPLASRVPADCFYIRYGSFENFLWFQDLSQEYGGDISRMVTLRGVKNESFQRMETQLSLSTSAMSRMLGPQVIEDQAIIGRDLFMDEGASMGILLKSKSPFLLRTSLTGERATKARADDQVALTKVKIGDHEVSLLSSADNRVRSFLAEDGEYFLVTNSRTIVERFFEVAENGDSLAKTPAFQLSRKLMPLERNDTIFAYFSPAMLRGLVSPEYLIELRRRLYSKSEIAMVHMARLANAQEAGDSEAGIDELVSSGFLPSDFGARGDGSGLITVSEQMLDTLRGARGSFLPIADVKIDAVTPQESDWYAQIADRYSTNFPTIDPIMVGIQRQQVEGREGVERISIHAEIAPWKAEKYGQLAQQLGPPTKIAMQTAPDDIISIQAHVASPQLGPPTYLFAAIKDTTPPDPDEFKGLLNIYRSLRGMPGYLGAWPQPGALDRLPFGLGQGVSVGPGMNRLIGGLYRFTDGDFSILSFQPQVIESSLPFIQSMEVDDEAQVRLRVGNLKGSQLEGWANAQLYERAKSGSVAGADFLSLLTRQLSVDPTMAAGSAEQILGASLQCTLGGQYQYSEPAGRWESDAWNSSVPTEDAPADYEAPLMKWFRGASGSLTQLDDRVIADLTVDVARQ